MCKPLVSLGGTAEACPYLVLQALTVFFIPGVDDNHIDDIAREYKNNSTGRFKLPDKDLPRRVESHLLALKKKGRNKYRKGSGTDMKVITMINGIKHGDIDKWEGVGVIQTAINPADKTKPQGITLPLT